MGLVKAPSRFPDGYVDNVFTIWYKAGKPNPERLAAIIPVDDTSGARPHPITLGKWIRGGFIERAEELDAEVFQQLSDEIVAEKVAMLKRHAITAKEMQGVAIEVLRERRDEITVNAAIRMWIEGRRIEYETAGIPEALEKVSRMSDEDLLGEIEDIIGRAEVEFLPPEV